MYNVLVIDDEKHVRQTIAFLGMWEKNRINPPLEATDGQSALLLLETHPIDIVLVDIKMPIMDGMQFLEIATKRFSKVKYVIISGFNEFDYAKKAIRFQIMDYLLKPISDTELNNCLEKAVKLLDEEQALLQENPLLDITNSLCSRSTEASCCAIASIHIAQTTPFSWENKTISILLDCLSNHTTLGEEYLICKEHPRTLILGILVPNCTRANIPKRIVSNLTQAANDYFHMTQIISLIGLGTFAQPTVSDLKSSYQKAALISSRLNLYAKEPIISMDYKIYESYKPYSISCKKEPLHRALEKWDINYFSSILKQYFRFLQEKELVNAETLVCNSMELLILLQEFSHENSIENYQEILPSFTETTPFKEIGTVGDFIEFFCSLVQELHHLADSCLNLTIQNITLEIKTYLEENYDRDISLTFFSNKYHMTKEYLSKQFKRQYGAGIYEYLLSFRMQRAGEYLRATQMKIQEISNQVGYADTSYFSKAFKNYYGLSPKEYRQSK